MILLLNMYGPLQSYGIYSRHLIRYTDRMPTKSAVVGMLCAALGINSRTERFSPIKLLDLINLKMAIRLDRPGTLLTDFHTIQDVALVGTPQNKCDSIKKSTHQQVVVTKRQYIQDAQFLVALQGPKEVLTAVVSALDNPKWFLSLGRKSCPVPPDMVVGLYEDDDICSFLASQPWQRWGRGEKVPSQLEIVVESNRGEIKQDVTLSLNRPKRYGIRHVEHHMVELNLDMVVEV